jgi:hypothetical protein
MPSEEATIMTGTQKLQIENLRGKGESYAAIA